MKKAAGVKFPCGCIAERSVWTRLCEQHQRDEDEIHKRWAAERAAQQTTGATNENA
jgi:hypothetical protein